MTLLKLGHKTIPLLGIYPKEIIRNGLADVSTGCSLQQCAQKHKTGHDLKIQHEVLIQ